MGDGGCRDAHGLRVRARLVRDRQRRWRRGRRRSPREREHRPRRLHDRCPGRPERGVLPGRSPVRRRSGDRRVGSVAAGAGLAVLGERRRRHRAGRPRRRLAGPRPVRRRRAGWAEHRPGPGGPGASTPTGRPRAAGARGRRCPTGRSGRTRGRTVPSPTSTETVRSSWCCSSSTTRADKNAGLYRTAALGSDGTASGWSSWVSVPDWFAFENVGAGLAVGDLDGDGTPELLVLMVDSAVGKNDAFYSVGWRLDGPPSRWVGAVAEGARLGLPREPGGRNHRGRPRRRRPPRPGRARRGQPGRAERGLVRVVPWRRTWPPPRRRASGASSRWTPGCSPYTPRCCPRATSSSSPDRVTTRTPRPPQRYGTRVWHYPAPAMSAPDTPVDLFCCGHAHLPDGRLAAGGTERYDPFVGLKQCVVFDPAAGPLSPASPTGRAGRWTSQPAMGQGRWYPTLVVLPDGEVRAARRAQPHPGRGAARETVNRLGLSGVVVQAGMRPRSGEVDPGPRGGTPAELTTTSCTTPAEPARPRWAAGGFGAIREAEVGERDAAAGHRYKWPRSRRGSRLHHRVARAYQMVAQIIIDGAEQSAAAA